MMERTCLMTECSSSVSRSSLSTGCFMNVKGILTLYDALKFA